MKDIRCFFSVWIVVQLLVLFPVYSRAETTEVLSATKQEEDAQVEEYSVDTDVGRITVNTEKAVVGQTVRITIDQKKLSDDKKDINGSTKETSDEKPDVSDAKKEVNDQKKEASDPQLFGWLRLSKTDQQYEQERQLSFSYNAETTQWLAEYTVTPHDLEGNWQLDVLMNGEGEPIEQKVDLLHIENKESLPDKEGPKVEELFVLNHVEGMMEMKKGESLTIRVKAKDAESSVKQVTMHIEGKEANFTFPLQYEKKEDRWVGKYEIAEKIPVGTYKLLTELVDAAGNKSVTESQYVISVVAEDKKQETTDSQKEEPKDQKQPEKKEDADTSKEAIITIVEPSKQYNSTLDQVVEPKEQPATSKDKEVVQQKKDYADEKKEDKKQRTGVQSSDLFAIISGGFLLFFILKNNKEWGS